MAPSPVNRPSSEQAIKHPWIVIEDDNESDNGNFRGSQEAYTVPMYDPGDDITQPDIHWTTDIDTAKVESLSGVQPGAEEQGCQNTSQRPHPSHQEVITEEPAAMNSERRYVLVSDDYEDQDECQDKDKDKNRIESSQNLTSDLCFSDHSTSNLTQASLDLEDERIRKGLNKGGSSRDRLRPVYTHLYGPAEESEDTQSASEVETEDVALMRRRIRKSGHRIPAEFLSRRVLSELGYRYELSKTKNLIILHKDVSEGDIEDLVMLSHIKRTKSPRARSRSVDRLPRLNEYAVSQLQNETMQYERTLYGSRRSRKVGSTTSMMAICGGKKHRRREPKIKTYKT